MNAIFEQIKKVGIVPVIKIDLPDTAVPLARALSDGGIPIAEVTFRTAHAAEAIRRIVQELPDVLVGAGTVLTTEQVDSAIEAGARFIVTPGFNPKIVDYCLAKGIPVVPGVSGTSDIEKAIECGLETVKCFPAEQMGGIGYIKAVAGPYNKVHFMPTGGIGPGNINNYLAFEKVVACGGSWMICSDRIAAGDYGGITQLCREAVDTVLGLEFAHLGINSIDEKQAAGTALALSALLGSSAVETTGSFLPAPGLEVLKKIAMGTHGHIAIATNSIERAVFQLERRGAVFNHEMAGKDATGHEYIFFRDEIAGFSVHLLQK